MSMDSFLSALRGVGKKALDYGQQGMDTAGAMAEKGMGAMGDMMGAAGQGAGNIQAMIEAHPLVRDAVSAAGATPEAIRAAYDAAEKEIMAGIAEGRLGETPPSMQMNNEPNPYGLGTGVNPGMPPADPMFSLREAIKEEILNEQAAGTPPAMMGQNQPNIHGLGTGVNPGMPYEGVEGDLKKLLFRLGIGGE